MSDKVVTRELVGTRKLVKKGSFNIVEGWDIKLYSDKEEAHEAIKKIRKEKLSQIFMFGTVNIVEIEE